MTTSIQSIDADTSAILVNSVESLRLGSGGVANLNGGQLAGLRNLIINGRMDIAQRGTSASIGPNAGAIVVDRFSCHVVGAGVVTASQVSDTPSNNEFINSLRMAVTTVDSSIAAGDYSLILQKVEGFNARNLIGRPFTLSFWVRSSKIGVHCVSFRNSGADRSYVTEYSVSVANTWEWKSVKVPVGLITTGTWNWTNGTGLEIAWALAAGSTFHTTKDAWQTGNLLSTSAQVNCLDSTSNIFALTGVQLEAGLVATPFEHRHYGLEFALCQRYYQFLDEVLVAGYGIGGNSVFQDHALPVYMRIAPTATITLGSGANNNASTATLNVAYASHIRFQTPITSTGHGYSIVDCALNAEL